MSGQLLPGNFCRERKFLPMAGGSAKPIAQPIGRAIGGKPTRARAPDRRPCPARDAGDQAFLSTRLPSGDGAVADAEDWICWNAVCGGSEMMIAPVLGSRASRMKR